MSNETGLYNAQFDKIIQNINTVLVDKEEIAVLSIVALLAEGHVLLEDVPGVGKTMLVKTLAKSIDAEFKRIQFTPDLLPSDVTGVSIYNTKTEEFEFHKGPIFGDVVLADEINRTSPKTQSSLLEAMEEHHVTIDGETRALPKPFFVMATQNPIEYAGTYPLPEAQLDRFLLKLRMGYPTPKAELEMLVRHANYEPLNEIEAVINQVELKEMQVAVNEVHIEDNVLDYIVHLTQSTREHSSIALGVSPRGSLALMRAAKAYAYICNRDFVVPDDVKYLVPYVFGHRIMLTSEAQYSKETADSVIQSILNTIEIPIQKGMYYEI